MVNKLEEYKVKDCFWFFHKWSKWTTWSKLDSGSEWQERKRICTNCGRAQFQRRSSLKMVLD